MLCFYHGVHVIAADMGSEQNPTPMRAHFLDRSQYRIATDPIEAIGALIHACRLGRGAHRVAP